MAPKGWGSEWFFLSRIGVQLSGLSELIHLVNQQTLRGASGPMPECSDTATKKLNTLLENSGFQNQQFVLMEAFLSSMRTP